MTAIAGEPARRVGADGDVATADSLQSAKEPPPDGTASRLSAPTTVAPRMIFDLCGQPRPAAHPIDGCLTGTGLIREHYEFNLVTARGSHA